MFRPTLMLFGLFLGYFVFASMSFLIRTDLRDRGRVCAEHGWIVTNVLGVVVLLSIFVMTHVVAALMSFRMISLVPHHVPRLIGFHGAIVSIWTNSAAMRRSWGLVALSRPRQSGLRQGMQQAGSSVQVREPEQLAGPSTGGSLSAQPRHVFRSARSEVVWIPLCGRARTSRPRPDEEAVRWTTMSFRLAV